MRTVPYDHPDARKLIAEVQQEYVLRYGGEDGTPTDPAEFTPPDGLFIVGYVGGDPVACGGWRVHDSGEPLFADGDAEIKRMYVTARLRGRGLARELLAELERTAAQAGRLRMVLETGQAQPEAIGLYRSSGYAEIEKFGHYRDSPACVCYGKHLDPHPSSPGFCRRVDAPTV